jgi:hypothetical protein
MLARGINLLAHAVDKRQGNMTFTLAQYFKMYMTLKSNNYGELCKET